MLLAAEITSAGEEESGIAGVEIGGVGGVDGEGTMMAEAAFDGFEW